ncbi:MAG: response regulator [Desulfuromonadales bacterium]
MSKKLLLADDSITIQKVIGITFANEDYELSIVDNGETALETARTFCPDLILADVFMPGKNGYELCAAIRNDPALKNTPLLLLTGTFEPFDEGKAKASGANSWISKPFESQALIDRVEELLAKAAASPAPAAPAEAPVAPAAAQPVATPPAAAPPVAMPSGPKIEIPDEADDFWGDDLPESLDADMVEETTLAGQDVLESAEEGADDLWGGIDLEEETAIEIAPAAEAHVEEFAVAEDVWGELAEETASGSVQELYSATVEETTLLREEKAVNDSQRPAAVGPVVDTGGIVDSDWEEFGEDILALDECDILEEEDLLEAGKPADAFADRSQLADPFADPLLDADDSQSDACLTEPAADDARWGDLNDEAKIAEPVWEDLADEPAGGAETVWEDAPEKGTADVAAASTWEITDEETIAPIPAPVVAAPAPVPPPAKPVAPPALPAASVEAQVSALSEEDIARIVEKVAGTVIERLAPAILEKIIWEVVPDLAEAMIREEIRLIKEDIQ